MQLLAVSHVLLLNRLQYRFGITGIALNWIKEYLEDHSQSGVFRNLDTDGAKPDEKTLKQGVSQGSVLGPILFILYILPIGDICRIYNINFHSYADVQQIYLSFKPSIKGYKEQCTTIPHNCMRFTFANWMHMNLLKLNDDNTEFIITGSQLQLAKVDNISLVIGQDTNQPTESAHNPGYYMESELKGRAHISKLCSSLYLAIKKIARVRYMMDKDTTALIMQALVLSRLD